ncbi:hypothetical protein [Micromonospora sp. CPCC 206061]|uniref:hypothetical protein n=1 Tax=Micromonospora sp. CPCC 206061 TaxID=3122410 RepID=UPI002FF34EB4
MLVAKVTYRPSALTSPPPLEIGHSPATGGPGVPVTDVHLVIAAVPVGHGLSGRVENHVPAVRADPGFGLDGLDGSGVGAIGPADADLTEQGCS